MDARPHVLALGFALVCAIALPAGAQLGSTAVAGPSRVVLTTDKSSFFLGENVLVHYCLENTSSQLISMDAGGDYRGASRSQRFKMTVRDEQGRMAPDPDPNGYNLGGMSGVSTLKPAERWCQSLPLMRYARIDAPGTYEVRVTHDLGWPKGQAPEGQVSVTFAMPTPEEAERVLTVMGNLPPYEGTVQGRVSTPYPDFSALRYPVYLSSLLRRARAGQAQAIIGVGVIPTPEATRALIDLVASDNLDVARRAAQTLAMRLPDPELTGGLTPRNILGNDLASPRNYLRNTSWRPEFASDVRAAARKLFVSADVQDVVEGAFFLEAVGEIADAPDLSAALTRALERTLTLPFETGGYPRPRGAAAELMRAAEMLIARGYVPPATRETPGDVALWLVALGRGARPDGWQDGVAHALTHRIPYVREVALDKMPDDVPQSLVTAVGANLEVSDIDVQIAACRLVGRAKLQILRAPVTAIFQQAKEFWLRNASGNALFALGGRIDFLQIQARRLIEADVAQDALMSLLGVFDSNGHSGAPISPDQGRALSERWLNFIAAHRTELEAGARLSLDRSDIPTDLLPAGWILHRSGKPDWPPR